MYLNGVILPLSQRTTLRGSGYFSVFISVFAGLGLFTANQACSNLLLRTADSVYNSFPSFQAAIGFY